MKVIQTAQNISMLKVISLASLKLSGSFRARRAKTKQKTASRPMYPRTAQNPIAEPNAHSRMIRFLYILRFFIGKGGLRPNQIVHIKTWMNVKDTTVILCCGRPNHFMTLLPGSVALKAIKTTIVFPRTQEMQRTKVIPNAVWRSMQDQSEGAPMKVSEHKKQRVREKSSKKLSSELLALTIGDVLWWKNTAAVTMARQAPAPENTARMNPRTSSKERNSTGLGRQVSPSALGQNSLGQVTQSRESEKINKKGF